MNDLMSLRLLCSYLYNFLSLCAVYCLEMVSSVYVCKGERTDSVSCC